MNNYQPSVAAMTDSSKWQQLSLKEAADFDKKFFPSSGTTRLITTGWTKVCMDRAARGVSRKARLKAKKLAAQEA